jgi:hypothetical protein
MQCRRYSRHIKLGATYSVQPAILRQVYAADICVLVPSVGTVVFKGDKLAVLSGLELELIR